MIKNNKWNKTKYRLIIKNRIKNITVKNIQKKNINLRKKTLKKLTR